MNDWSPEEIRNLQQEAKKRVMEMKERSRFAAQDMNRSMEREKNEMPASPDAPKVIRMPVEFERNDNKRRESAEKASECGVITVEEPERTAHGKEIPDRIKSILPIKISNEESERLFLLSLCLLLGSERADHETLLALMYIMS